MRPPTHPTPPTPSLTDAQTQGGTWTVSFTVPAALSGTAYLTVSASITQGRSPAERRGVCTHTYR